MKTTKIATLIKNINVNKNFDEVINFNGEHTYVVELEEDAGGYVIEADNLVSTHDWVEYVDERCAKVIRVPYEA